MQQNFKATIPPCKVIFVATWQGTHPHLNEKTESWRGSVSQAQDDLELLKWMLVDGFKVSLYLLNIKLHKEQKSYPGAKEKGAGQHRSKRI